MGPVHFILFFSILWPSLSPIDGDERVVDVQVVGNQRVTTEQILSRLHNKVGQPFDPVTNKQDIEDLYEEYGIKVTTSLQVVEGGVRYILQVDEDVMITKVEVEGVSEGRGDELLDEMSLSGARTILPVAVRERARELQHRLKDEGYYFATVKVDVKGGAKGATATLMIHEGPKVEVEDIRFVGLHGIPASTIKKVMSTQATWLFFFKSYLRVDALDRDLIEVQRYLRNEGFRDAQVSLEKIEFNAKQDEAIVTLRIQEGSRYAINKLIVEGNEAISTDEILSKLDLKPGSPIREVAVERGRHEILDLYGAMGYVRCEIGVRENYGETGTLVDVIYTIHEGLQQRIREVIITGNRTTRDEVIRREVTLEPDDIASTTELARTIDRLRSLGYFVDDAGQDDLQVQFRPTDSPELEDLFIDVTETQSDHVFFSAGADSDIGFYAGVFLEKRNFDITDLPSSWNPGTLYTEISRNEAFHGGGQELLLQVVPGNKYSNYTLSFVEPYLFGPDRNPYSLGFDLYGRTYRSINKYDESRYGVGISLSKQIQENWEAGVTGGFEVVDISGLGKNPPNEVKDYKGSNVVPSIGLFGRFEKFNRLIMPSEGYDFGARYELLLGDASGQKIVLDGSRLFPLMEDDRGRDHVLAVKGVAGFSHGFGDDLPFFERFQAGGNGGEFPLRGFQYRRVGPEKKEVHLGGNMAYTGSVEYQFPLYSSYDPFRDREDEMLRGVVFMDLGSVEDSFSDLASTPRLSVGGGLRIQLPMLGRTPVAVDMGFPVLSESDDETEIFSFRVSTRF